MPIEGAQRDVVDEVKKFFFHGIHFKDDPDIGKLAWRSLKQEGQRQGNTKDLDKIEQTWKKVHEWHHPEHKNQKSHDHADDEQLYHHRNHSPESPGPDTGIASAESSVRTSVSSGPADRQESVSSVEEPAAPKDKGMKMLKKLNSLLKGKNAKGEGTHLRSALKETTTAKDTAAEKEPAPAPAATEQASTAPTAPTSAMPVPAPAQEFQGAPSPPPREAFNQLNLQTQGAIESIPPAPATTTGLWTPHSDAKASEGPSLWHPQDQAQPRSQEAADPTVLEAELKKAKDRPQRYNSGTEARQSAGEEMKKRGETSPTPPSTPADGVGKPKSQYFDAKET